MSTIKSFIIGSLLLLCTSATLHAVEKMDTLIIPDNLGRSFTLERGIYTLRKDVLIAENTTLTIPDSCTLIFHQDARLIVRGSLIALGTKENRIKFEGADGALQGKGIEVAALSPAHEITLQNCDFSKLSKPLQFREEWYRKTVRVEYCTFYQNESRTSIVSVPEPAPSIASATSLFYFNHNTFASNYGNVFIDNLVTPEFKLFFQDNVFIRNSYSSVVPYNYPVVIRFNDFGLSSDNQIDNNAFYANQFEEFQNRQVSAARSFLFMGDGETVQAGNLYTNHNTPMCRESLYALSDLFDTPHIAYSHKQRSSDSFNGFYSSILINDTSDFYEAPTAQLVKSISLVTNKPAVNFDDMELISEKKDASIESKEMVNDSTYHVVFQNPIQSSDLASANLRDENGVPFPPIQLNHNLENRTHLFDFNAQLNDTSGYYLFPKLCNLEHYGGAAVTKSEEDNGIRYNPVEYAKGNLELGLVVGLPIYYGDLFQYWPLVVDPSAIGSKFYVSPRIQYNKKFSKFSFEGRLNFMQLEGADNRNTAIGKYRGTGFERDLRFRTQLYGISVLAHYDFRQPRQMDRWIFGLHAGVDMFYFNPQNQYQGEWFDLRKIGTEGQTANGEENAYGPISFGIPGGIHLSRYIKRNWKIALTMSYTFTFTDYLDDVGSLNWADEQAIRRANPDNPDAAAYLANPNGSGGIRTNSSALDAYANWGIGIFYNFRLKATRPRNGSAFRVEK